MPWQQAFFKPLFHQKTHGEKQYKVVESLSSFLVGEGWNGVAWLHAGFQE
jgi:hypothetical protein